VRALQLWVFAQHYHISISEKAQNHQCKFIAANKTTFLNKKSVVSPKPTADSVETYRKYVIMCVSNEQCRMKAEKRAVLAQSSFRRLLLIGRKPDRAGKCNFSAHARRAQRKRIAMRSRARSATARIREHDSEVNRPTEQGKTARKWS